MSTETEEEEVQRLLAEVEENYDEKLEKLLAEAPRLGEAYDRVSFRGHRFDKITRQALRLAEHRLGYELTVYQGSYNRSVGASAGTHDGGGAVDLAPYDHARKVLVLRRIGFAAWYRPASSSWVAHIHALLGSNRLLANLAELQVRGYNNYRNGLGPWPFSPDPNRSGPHPLPKYDYKRGGLNFHNKEGHLIRSEEEGDLTFNKVH